MSRLAEQQPLLAYPYVEGHVHPEPPKRSTIAVWRENIAHVLESQVFHTFVIALIVIDVTCVLADLGHIVLSDKCAPRSDEDPAWLEVLENISLAITTLFLIEIPIALWTFGFRFYNPFSGVSYAALHLFDAVIIVTTFVLEFILEGRQRELAGLLITLRLWRLVKLVGGIAVGTGELHEQTVKELEETKRQLEGTTIALAKAREENRKLRGRVAWLETGGSEGTEF